MASRNEEDQVNKTDQAGNDRISTLESKVEKIGKKDRITLIISAMALCISLGSFVVSGITSSRDAYYKELAIKPDLQLFENRNPYAASVDNVGVGSGLIKRVMMRDGSNCVDSKYSSNLFSDQDNFMQNLSDEVLRQLRYRLYNKYNKNLDIKLDYTAKTIRPGNLIGPKESHSLIAITMTPLDANVAGNDVIQAEVEINMRDAFRDVLYSRGFIFEYCSISEKFCDILKSNDSAEYCQK